MSAHQTITTTTTVTRTRKKKRKPIAKAYKAQVAKARKPKGKKRCPTCGRPL